MPEKQDKLQFLYAITPKRCWPVLRVNGDFIVIQSIPGMRRAG